MLMAVLWALLGCTSITLALLVTHEHLRLPVPGWLLASFLGASLALVPITFVVLILHTHQVEARCTELQAIVVQGKCVKAEVVGP